MTVLKRLSLTGVPWPIYPFDLDIKSAFLKLNGILQAFGVQCAYLIHLAMFVDVDQCSWRSESYEHSISLEL
jgi:hypothetical protein